MARRNLTTRQTTLATGESLASKVPEGRVVVGGSGLKTRPDLDRLGAAGIRSFLIGESLMRQSDVATATRELLTPTTGTVPHVH
ncbi:hypothetical protein ACF061_38360 [Streptomyces sp. NPDC015220]|uniref:hypothetical protein n=1 Tax=Streptomyces sp. NPDC015220 TaxID=3364947 RepID=UPI0036F8CD32